MGVCPLFAQSEVQEEQSTETSYRPTIYGAVKAKYELSTSDTDFQRFNVRNSRIGVKGLASEYMKYAIQIDFNNEGKLSILDSYVAFVSRDFELTLGQQQYHFSSDLDRGPTSNMFSNRSFLAKFLTTYYGQEVVDGKEVGVVSTIGSRDIGAMLTYTPHDAYPLSASIGLFNGSGANNPEWTHNVNFITRLMIGYDKGFGGAISYYKGTTPTTSRIFADPTGALMSESFEQKIEMFGGELHYIGDDFLVEAEYAQRRLGRDVVDLLEAAHIHGYYLIRMKKGCFLNHIAPHLRYDIGRGIEFVNMNTGLVDRFNTDRITIALNFGLKEIPMRSDLRIAFEKYLPKQTPSDFAVNGLLHDKITIEVVAAF